MLDEKYKNKIINFNKKYCGRTSWLSKISQKIETIRAAAISINGRVFTGRNHFEALIKAFTIMEGVDLMGLDKINEFLSLYGDQYTKWLDNPAIADRREGFWTSRRRFVDRETAFEIADKAEQLREKADVYQETSLDSGYVK